MKRQRYLAELNKAICDLEATFNDFMDWTARLYDKKQKGFHLAQSAWENPEKYYCSIDTTAQALNILQYSKVKDGKSLLDVMPEEIKNDVTTFFKSRQHPEKGYFYDNDPAMYNNPRVVARALTYAVDSLKKLGSKPIYELPRQQSVQHNFPELSSLKSWQQYLRSLDWTNPYFSGDWSAIRAIAADQLPEPLRTQIIEEYWSFIDSIQSADTGMWGKDVTAKNHIYVSGVMKIGSAYHYYNKDIPNMKRVKDSIVWVVANDHEVDKSYCFVRNPLSALEFLKSSGSGGLTEMLNEEEKLSLIVNTTLHHARFLKKDGGFSRTAIAALKGEGGLILGKGLVEGDTNAGTQAAHTVRRVCYELADRVIPPMPGADGFYRVLDA